MRIVPMSFAYTPQKITNPRFCGYSKTVCHNNEDDVLYRTTTYLFRDDLDWKHFVNILRDKYKNTNKVHIINHACSDGEETFSLITKLMHHLGEDAEKFFPVSAKDIDEGNIRRAKKSKYKVEKIKGNFDNSEYSRILYETSGTPERYFEINNNNQNGAMYITPKKELKNKVNFSVGNIIEDVKNMPKKVSNTVFICRNFWPYLKYTDRVFLAEELGKKLDESCIVVVGDYDYHGADIHKRLSEQGFKADQREINVFYKE